MITNTVGIGRYTYLNSNTTSRSKTNTKASTSTSTESTSTGSEKKNTSSLPNSAIKKIQEMARKGAENGVYMGDEFANFCKQYKQVNITPDYSKLQSRLTFILNKQSYMGKNLLFNLLGYSCKMGVGLTHSFISVCDENGDEVLFYDSKQGWIARPSKAKNQFQDEATAVYYEAYKAARAEMQTGSAQTSSVTSSSSIDVQA